MFQSVCFQMLQMLQMLQIFKAWRPASRLGSIFARERDEEGSSWCFLGFDFRGYHESNEFTIVYLTKCHSIHSQAKQPLPNTATKQCLWITRLPTRSHSIHRRFSRFCSRYSDCTNFTRIVPRRWTRENDGVLHMIDQDLYLYIYIYIYNYIYNYIILYICTGIYIYSNA